MQCFSPKYAFRILQPDGKYKLKFCSKKYYEDFHPVDQCTGERLDMLTIPCGKCEACKANYSKHWSTRCYLESLEHEHNYFITLTYADESLKFRDYSPLPTLCKEDLQKFFKRLRAEIGAFRYFACGEYGSTTSRPHYHFILFSDFDLFPFLKFHTKSPSGELLYECQFLADIWKNGQVIVGECTPASCSYVAQYVNKKLAFSGEYDDLNVNKPFIVMSRRPGIGFHWLEENKELLKSFIQLPDGKRSPLPKAFRDKLKDSDPLMLEKIIDLYKQYGSSLTDFSVKTRGLSEEQLNEINREHFLSKINKRNNLK